MQNFYIIGAWENLKLYFSHGNTLFQIRTSEEVYYCFQLLNLPLPMMSNTTSSFQTSSGNTTFLQARGIPDNNTIQARGIPDDNTLSCKQVYKNALDHLNSQFVQLTVNN